MKLLTIICCFIASTSFAQTMSMNTNFCHKNIQQSTAGYDSYSYSTTEPIELSFENFLYNRVSLTFELSRNGKIIYAIFKQTRGIEPVTAAKFYFVYDNDIRSADFLLSTSYTGNSWRVAFYLENNGLNIFNQIMQNDLKKIRLEYELNQYYTLNISPENALKIKKIIGCLEEKMH